MLEKLAAVTGVSNYTCMRDALEVVFDAKTITVINRRLSARRFYKGIMRHCSHFRQSWIILISNLDLGNRL
jgi:hypothetical protein